MDQAIRTRHLSIRDRTVRCLVSGDPGGPGTSGVVVFLHAFPLNADMWRAPLSALPAGWAGIAPDFRGFGASTPDWPPAPPRPDARLDDYVDDVLAVMDASGVSRAVFCGCSMDGISCPVLVIAGEEDVLIPAAEAEALRDGIPGSRLVMIPGAGHLPNLEQPDAFNAVLVPWLAGVSQHGSPPLDPARGALSEPR